MKYIGEETLGRGEDKREVLLYSDGYFNYRCYLGYDRDAEPIFTAVDRSPFHQSTFRPAPIEDVCRCYREFINCHRAWHGGPL